MKAFGEHGGTPTDGSGDELEYGDADVGRQRHENDEPRSGGRHRRGVYEEASPVTRRPQARRPSPVASGIAFPVFQSPVSGFRFPARESPVPLTPGPTRSRFPTADPVTGLQAASRPRPSIPHLTFSRDCDPPRAAYQVLRQGTGR